MYSQTFREGWSPGGVSLLHVEILRRKLLLLNGGQHGGRGVGRQGTRGGHLEQDNQQMSIAAS